MEILGAFGCSDFGNLSSTFNVLCTQHRCSRVVGYASTIAFQNPDAPSPTATAGAIAKPARFQVHQQFLPTLLALPVAVGEPINSFRPSGVAPINTSMHSACGSRRIWK